MGALLVPSPMKRAGGIAILLHSLIIAFIAYFLTADADGVRMSILAALFSDSLLIDCVSHGY